MANKVDLDKYGSKRPKLTPEDLEGDAAVLTVAGFEQFMVKDDVGERPTAILVFEETGDKALFLNKTMLSALVERLGNDGDKYIGEKVPIEARKVTYQGKTTTKLYVMAAEEWDHAFEEAGLIKRSKKPKGVKKSKR